MIKGPKADNKKAALATLKATEKRLGQNSAHAAVYRKQIENMIEKGVPSRLRKKEIEDYNGSVCLISHHHVLQAESKTTPRRIVFNSSANFNGHVLNEYYAKGLDMLNNLLGVLLTFRGPIAIIGDSAIMFYSIDILLLDQMTHRFLWRDLDERMEPGTYVMSAVNMGDRPPGTMAIATLRKTAEMSRDVFPRSS